MKVLLDDEIDLSVEPPVFSTIVYAPTGTRLYTASATRWHGGWWSTNQRDRDIDWISVREDIMDGNHPIALFIPEDSDPAVLPVGGW